MSLFAPHRGHRSVFCPGCTSCGIQGILGFMRAIIAHPIFSERCEAHLRRAAEGANEADGPLSPRLHALLECGL
jgi:hypothetical protein